MKTNIIIVLVVLALVGSIITICYLANPPASQPESKPVIKKTNHPSPESVTSPSATHLAEVTGTTTATF